MSVYRSVSQLHENTRLIQFGATAPGRLLIWAAATVLLWVKPSVALIISPLLAMLLLFPERRRAILAIGAIAAWFVIAMDSGLTEPVPLFTTMAAIAGMSWLFFLMALKFEKMPPVVQRFPLLFAHWPALFLIGVAFFHRVADGPLLIDPIHGAVLGLMTFLLWRWSYLLFSGRRGSIRGSRFVDHLFYLMPSYGGSDVPMGKGHDYLSRRAPVSALDVSRAQLAGLKLLVLMHVWRWVRKLMNASLDSSDGGVIQRTFGEPGIEKMQIAFQILSDSPGDIAVSTAWAMLFVSLAFHVIWIAIFGHLIVGCLRLFGFNVYRNTYKPLLSVSVVEYWNRFYYYFKELLVEFFFYPTFAACSKFPHRLRLFLSVMAAACLGNIYFHVLRDIDLYLSSSNEQLISLFASRLTYSTALGLGVFVSMLRESKRRRKKTGVQPLLIRTLIRTRRMLGVWLFFGLLLVWIDGPDVTPFADRLAFFLALFGVR